MSKVKCPDCDDIIESKTRHDFQKCSCGETFIDGGNDYIRTTPRAIFIKEGKHIYTATYAIRTDIKSQDNEYKDKLMHERGLKPLNNSGWTRELISDEKYKREYLLTDPSGRNVITHIMETERTDTGNIFLNWNMYHKYDCIEYDALLICVDFEKNTPTYIWFSELKKMMLKTGQGTTLGYLIPKNKTHELNSKTVKDIETKISL